MERLLSAAQLADHLGMHVKTLYKLLRDNKIALTFVRLHGRVIAFRPADVERYLNSREVIRDGSGTKSKRKKQIRPAPTYHVMTDEEAQEFFKNVQLVDGILESAPETYTDD